MIYAAIGFLAFLAGSFISIEVTLRSVHEIVQTEIKRGWFECSGKYYQIKELTMRP